MGGLLLLVPAAPESMALGPEVFQTCIHSNVCGDTTRHTHSNTHVFGFALAQLRL